MGDLELEMLEAELRRMKRSAELANTIVKYGLRYVSGKERTAGGVHTSVSIAPHGTTSLEKEREYTCAALLYSDEVTVCSPNAAMLQAASMLDQLSLKERIGLLAEVVPLVMEGPEALETTRALAELATITMKSRPSRNEFLRLAKLKPMVTTVWPVVSNSILAYASEQGLDDFRTGIEAGILHVLRFSDLTDGKTIAQSYLDSVHSACADPGTIPLLDEQTSGLVESALKEGIITLDREQRPLQKHGVVAAKLLQRLPGVRGLSIEETLALRAELSTYLTPFRAEMLKLSQAMASATWDADFAYDVDETFHREVAPAMLEIENQLRSGSVLKAIGRGVLSADVISGSFVGVAVANMPMFANYAAPIGAAVGLARSVNQEVTSALRARGDAKKSGFYYYYLADKELGCG